MNHVISHTNHRFLVTLFFLFGASTLHAAIVPVASTGYTLSIPDEYTVLPAENSPGALLQADSPTGESSLQVVAAAPGEPQEALASDYEAMMSTIFDGLEPLSSEQVEVGGVSRLLKTYLAQSNQGSVRITALFLANISQSMIVHAVDLSGNHPIMRDMVTSITPPTPGSNAQNHRPRRIKSAVSQPAAASSASTAPIPKTPDGYHWFTEKSSGLRWLVPQTWQVELADSSILFIPPSDDALADAGGLQVQNLSRQIERFSTVEKATEELDEFVEKFDGKILATKEESCNGIPCRLVELEVALSEDDHHHMWFVYFTGEEMITLIQYDTFGTAKKLADQIIVMKAHLKQGLDSIRK